MDADWVFENAKAAKFTGITHATRPKMSNMVKTFLADFLEGLLINACLVLLPVLSI